MKFINLIVYLCLLAGALKVAAQPVAATKLPAPTASAQADSVKLVHEVFQDDIDKAKSPEQKSALALKLIQQAEETKDDPAGRFVLLQEAIDQAAQAVDISVALKAVDQIVKYFNVDAVKLKTDALTKVAATAKLPVESEPTLKELARQESAAATTAPEQMKLGDAWWNFGQTLQDPMKKATLLRACDWYQRAAPALTGLLKLKVEKRLAETGPKTGEQITPLNRAVAFVTELHIAADGKGSLKIDTRPSVLPPFAIPEGSKEVRITGLENAAIYQLKNGTITAVHDFSIMKTATDFQPSDGVFDPKTEAFALTPSQKPGGQNSATLNYPRSAKLPITVRLLLAEAPAHLQIHLHWPNGSVLLLESKEDSVSLVWRQGTDWKMVQSLVKLRQQPGSQVGQEFMVPLAESQRVEGLRIGLGSFKSVSIRRIEITAIFSAMFGIQMANSNGKVLIKSVLEGGAAKAGIKSGDFVTAFEGKPVRNIQDLMQRVAALSIGDTATLTIERDGKSLQMTVTGE